MSKLVTSLHVTQVEQPAVCILTPDAADNFRSESHFGKQIVCFDHFVNICFNFLVRRHEFGPVGVLGK